MPPTEKDTRWGKGGVSTRNFACGEDSHALRFLRAANADRIPRAARGAGDVGQRLQQKRTPDEGREVSIRNFACGEDSHALRLASKLADLRAANADRIPRAARGAGDVGRRLQQKRTPDGGRGE